MTGLGRWAKAGEAAAAALAFVVPLSSYIATLLPGVGYWGDVATLQYMGKILGLANPTGYPTYLVLNHLFGLLPLGEASLAYKINLLSAIFASGTTLLVYWVVRLLTGRALVALAAALALAFSPAFWSFAIVAEVYTLNALFIAAVALLLLLWRQRKKDRYYLAACLAYAISFGNHLTMITLLPAVAFFVLTNDWRTVVKPKNVAIVLLFILLGALQYAYLVIRSFSDVPYATANLRSVESVVFYVTGGPFRREYPTLLVGFDIWMGLRLGERLALALSQYAVMGYLVAGLGIFALARRKWNYAGFLVLGGLAEFLFATAYAYPNIEYAIPAYIFVAVAIGPGLAALLSRIQGLGGRLRSPLCIVLLASVAIYLGWRGQEGYAATEKVRSNHAGGEVFGVVLDAVASGSIIFTSEGYPTQALRYFQLGEGHRQGDRIWVCGPNWQLQQVENYLARKGGLRCSPLPGPPPGLTTFYLLGDRQEPNRQMLNDRRFQVQVIGSFALPRGQPPFSLYRLDLERPGS